MADIGAASTESLNLQARFEQLEGAISEAHGVVDSMIPRPDVVQADRDSPAAVSPNSSIATSERCTVTLANLISRLQNLRDRVGLVV